MNNIEKQHLIGILGKDELTMYDLSQLIEYMSKMFGSAEGPKFGEISKVIKEDIDDATRAVSGLTRQLTEIYNTIQVSIQSAYEATDQKGEETYQKYKQVVGKINKDIADLEKIKFPDINLPYNWKEVLEMTERLSQYPQEKREVFYELIKTFIK